MEGLALGLRNSDLNPSSTTQKSCLAYEPQFLHVQSERMILLKVDFKI